MYAFQHILGTDESDNFLAAKLILSGNLPYVDFFSHHMPGAYLLSCIIYVLSIGDPLMYRLLFCAVIYAWLIYNFIFIRRYANRYAALSYIVLASLSYGLSLQYQFLAETIIAFAVSTIIIWLLLLEPTELLAGKRLIALSLLLFFIPFSALSYVYVALLLYILTFVKLGIFSKNALRTIGILAAPYVLFAIYLIATGSLREFIFQNLTFNAVYYSVFLDSPGADPLTTGVNIAMTSLGQVWTVLTQPFSHFSSLLLLISFLLLPAIVLIKGQWLVGILLAALLLFANSRVSLYGVPAIQDFGSTTHHAGLYRTLAVLFFSLSFFYIGSIIKAAPARAKLYTRLAIVSIFVTITGSFVMTNNNSYSGGPQTGLSEYCKLPDPSIRIINTIATVEDYAWSGPINFLSQAYLVPKIATNYTFFMPWHQACPTCHDSFYKQMRSQAPIAIEWRQFEGIPSHPLPGYSKDMSDFLNTYYFQLRSDRPGFENLYFNKDNRSEIINKLTLAGYPTY